MADVIREAIIRIKLEQAAAKLTAPDITPLKRAHDEATKAVKQQEAAVEELSKASKEAAEAETKAAADAAKSHQTATNAMEAASRESSQVQITNAQQVAQANIEVADKLRTAAEGAFTLARGVAFLSASSDEDFQKMLRTLAQVQGAFDVFKGAVDTIKGLAEAQRALRTATQGANVALSLQKTLLGPVGLALAAVGAAAGAAALAYQALGKESEAAGKSLEDISRLHIRDMNRQLELAEGLVRLTDDQAEKQQLLNEQRSAELALLSKLDEPRKFLAEAKLSEAELGLFSETFEKELHILDQLRASGTQRQRNLQDQLNTQRQKVEAARAELETAEAALRADMEREASARVRLGMLNEAEQAEAVALAERAKAGDANRAELQRLLQLAGSHAGVRELGERRFIEFSRGFTGELSEAAGAGVTPDRDELQADLQRVTEEFAETATDVAEMNRATREGIEEQTELMEGWLEASRRFLVLQDTVLRRLDEMDSGARAQ